MKFHRARFLISLIFINTIKSALEPLKLSGTLLDEENEQEYLKHGISEKFFIQDLTHTNTESFKWNQRYFVNDQYYEPGGPAFLFIGGEDAISEKYVTYCLLATAAQKHKGVLYSLEHRFYGKSMPKEDLSLSNLRYLTTELALSDIYNFKRNVILPSAKRLNVTEDKASKTKWIVGGASYAGNLAAWTRLKYPEDFIGAIASSAPVLAKEDFYEYDEQVQVSLYQNGGKECMDYFIKVATIIDNILFGSDTKKKEDLKEKFGCKGIANGPFADSINYISSTIQSNNNNKVVNVKSRCKDFKVNGSDFEKLEDYIIKFKEHLQRENTTCQQITELNVYKNITAVEGAYHRQWLYQCCTEYGYFQTAPTKGTSARSRLLDVNYYRNYYCKNTFGEYGPFKPDVDKINKRYGGQNIRSSNTFFVNGDLDPWKPLSVYKNAQNNVKYHVIPGASHGTDSTIVNGFDTPEILEAKNKVLKYIDELLMY